MSNGRKGRSEIEEDHDRNSVNTIERKSTCVSINLDNVFKKTTLTKKASLGRVKAVGKDTANGEVSTPDIALLSVFLRPSGRVLSGVTVPGSESMLSGDLGMKILRVSLKFSSIGLPSAIQ